MNIPDSRYWRDDAACRMADAHLFEPPSNGDRPDGAVARLAAGRAICRTCPVQSRCLDDAVTNGDSGLFAGQYLEDGVPVSDPKPKGHATKFPQPKAAVVLVVDVHRPLDSYFGPADPLVLGELLDALLPPKATSKRAVA